VQSSGQIVTTNTQFFTGRMPFLLPNQQCQSTEGKELDREDARKRPGGIVLTLSARPTVAELTSQIRPIQNVC